MGKIVVTTDGRRLERVSRWIKVVSDYGVTERHSLVYYAQEACDGEKCVDYFRWRGRKWAVGQFLSVSGMMGFHIGNWEEEDGLHWISGYDSEDYFNPIMVEFDEYCENVRVYREL